MDLPRRDAPPPGEAHVAPGTRLGRFEVGEPLGAGGMGVVYSAFDPELHRRVAVKLLRAEAAGPLHAQEAHARLRREAQAMAQLSHPNVIAVFEVGRFGEQTFVVMELCEGGTAGSWLAAAPRRWRDVLEVFTRAGRGLAAAHRAGLVHRDFKPDNVLLGRDGKVCVTDFGLVASMLDGGAEPGVDGPTPAGHLALSITHTGALLGTPPYMAPEQHAGRPTDARTDQFSFCVALYEGLYGQRPFAGATYRELLRAVTGGVVRPAPAGSQVPAWLRRVVLRGLRVEAAERYPSMEDMLGALRDGPRGARSWRLAGFGAAAVVVGGAAVVALLLASGEPAPRPVAVEAGATGAGARADAGPGADLDRAEAPVPSPAPPGEPALEPAGEPDAGTRGRRRRQPRDVAPAPIAPATTEVVNEVDNEAERRRRVLELEE